MQHTKELYCPYCNSKKLYDYGSILECKNCLREFDKDDLNRIPDDEILSLDIKRKFVEIFMKQD